MDDNRPSYKINMKNRLDYILTNTRAMQCQCCIYLQYLLYQAVEAIVIPCSNTSMHVILLICITIFIASYMYVRYNPLNVSSHQ